MSVQKFINRNVFVFSYKIVFSPVEVSVEVIIFVFVYQCSHLVCERRIFLKVIILFYTVQSSVIIAFFKEILCFYRIKLSIVLVLQFVFYNIFVSFISFTGFKKAFNLHQFIFCHFKRFFRLVIFQIQLRQSFFDCRNVILFFCGFQHINCTRKRIFFYIKVCKFQVNFNRYITVINNF